LRIRFAVRDVVAADHHVERVVADRHLGVNVMI
jgi:hypothetical protein